MTDTRYIQPDALLATLGLTDTADESVITDIGTACLSGSKAVDHLTGRFFYRKDASNDETRLYTPLGPTVTIIDDLIGLTAIRFDRDGDGVYEIELAGTEYRLEPLNAHADGKPWERITMLNPWLSPTGVVGGVEVTGRFGWAEIPTEVVTSASIIATKLFKRLREAPFGVLSLGVDNVAIKIGSYDAEVQTLLKDFDRRAQIA